LLKYIINIQKLNKENKIRGFYSTRELVVYWSEFLAMDPEVPGSISGTTRYS
jgi:hypothetical protein